MPPAPAEGIVDHFIPGTMLGKYELLATIGQGGMANVILARQRGPAGFEKVVVIKVIHPHMAQNKGAVTMLLDEARVAAQIDHPNVVHTYELGEAHGTFYIVMEYLAGESFNTILRKQSKQEPLDPNMAGRIVAEVASGLHAAHELTDFSGKSLGIIHRDVSPGNIVVLYNGAVKVVDFGIAKAHGRVTSTSDGELKGKYGYMSPEQIRNEPMDHRSDVFSLGVVLWESLTTRRLFNANSVGATLMQVMTAERVPPSRHAPGVPPALDAIAIKALSIEPNDRFQSCAEMRTAIEDVIWQSRCGTSEIAAHMTALFADRMEQRRALLSRATRESFSPGDLEVIGTAFTEHSNTPMPGAPTTSALALPKPKPWGLIAGVVLLAIAGVVVYIVTRKDEPAIVENVASRPVPPEVAPATPGPAKPAVESAAESNPGAKSGESKSGESKAGESSGEPKAGEPKAGESKSSESKSSGEPKAGEPKAGESNSSGESKTGESKSGESKVNASKSGGSKPTSSKPGHKPVIDKPPKPEPPPAKPTESAAAIAKGASEAYLRGDFGGAEAAYKRAIAADRSYAPAYRGLGFLYQRTGDTKKALDALRTYLKLSPGAKDADAVKKRIEQLGST